MASVTRPTVVAFIAEFLRTGNATKSAIKAGYPEKTAYQQGFRLLKRPEVQEAIASANKVAMDEAIVDKTYVLKNLREVVERCLQRAPVMEFDPEEKQYSQKIDDKGNLLWEFDSAGANSALSSLARCLKMFTDKIEVDINESAFERLERARLRAKDAK